MKRVHIFTRTQGGVVIEAIQADDEPVEEFEKALAEVLIESFQDDGWVVDR